MLRLRYRRAAGFACTVASGHGDEPSGILWRVAAVAQSTKAVVTGDMSIGVGEALPVVASAWYTSGVDMKAEGKIECH